jgi:hypothetical protein
MYRGAMAYAGCTFTLRAAADFDSTWMGPEYPATDQPLMRGRPPTDSTVPLGEARDEK